MSLFFLDIPAWPRQGYFFASTATSEFTKGQSIDKLSARALQGVIEEFISREGTDFGAVEASYDTKFKQIKRSLENGSAVLLFDDETETTNILMANNLILKS